MRYNTVIQIYFLRLDLPDSVGLYEYVNARVTGENMGQCGQVYPQCSYSVFNIIHEEYRENNVVP